MVRRCTTCHRYVTGAPTPDLDHGGVGSGPDCTLEHHTASCDWEDDRRIGVTCSYFPDTVPVSVPEEQNAVQLLEERLAQLQREKEEESRRANLLQISNNNLRDSQSQLQQQNVHLQNLSHHSFYASATTTTTTTSALSAPLMGTGFTSSFMTPVSSTGVSVPASFPSSLASAASSHASRNNSATASSSRSIPGYGGPSLPEIRQDPQVSSFAQQVMGRLMREMPTLASYPSAGAAAAALPPGQGLGLPPPPPSTHQARPHYPQGPAHHPFWAFCVFFLALSTSLFLPSVWGTCSPPR